MKRIAFALLLAFTAYASAGMLSYTAYSKKSQKDADQLALDGLAKVWLDMLLTYAKGLFHPTQWAFEDFKRNPYQHDLQLIRERWRKSLRTSPQKTP